MTVPFTANFPQNQEVKINQYFPPMRQGEY